MFGHCLARFLLERLHDFLAGLPAVPREGEELDVVDPVGVLVLVEGVDHDEDEARADVRVDHQGRGLGQGGVHQVQVEAT